MPETGDSTMTAVDPAALDALNTDLLDALAAVERARLRLEQATGGSPTPAPFARGPETSAEPAPLRRTSVTEKHLQEVADVYRCATADGFPPTMAVARHFGASHSTAGRWVGMARGIGVLGPATRGKSGEVVA